ncbi:MAG TPA: Stk1 family PASTA domain-containing Ser/Thr kinase [Acidimicrobiales bacterium]|nr:Stk1 family PASTA domain-containing Ser/Thr kinase [Acidimicrobiales bacterium]
MPDESPPVYNSRYELVRRLARGGMAEVYLGRDLSLDRPVALKVLSPELSRDDAFVERFRREAQAAANLSHPNVVSVYDWGEAEGSYFIVMEHVSGPTLSSVIRSDGPLSAERAAKLGADIAAALAFAHRQGVIHRDVKPGNVLIAGDDHVKVTDFGIARATRAAGDANLTQTGAVLGTATYFSPEQAEGAAVDARSDVYSLGVVLYEMVTGEPPFRGDNPVSIAYKHVRETPELPTQRNPRVPPEFEAIVLKAMAKDPDHRYQSADELRADLLRFIQGRPLAVDPATALQSATAVVPPVTRQATVVESTPPRRGGRSGAYLGLLVVLLLLLAALLYLLARSLGLLGTSGKVTVPSVLGMSAAQATSTLTGDGLNVHEQDQTNPGSSPNTVYNQDPTAGTSLSKGGTVTIFVNKGVSNVGVPNVVGQNVNQASNTLQNAGFHVSVVNQPDSSPSGTVLSQTPSAGQSAPQGSTVTLTVSSGPNQVSVPDVTGLSEAQASNELGQAGFRVSVINQPDNSQPQGTVIAQNPPGGSQAPQGSTVTIAVSSGPSSTTTSSTTTSTTFTSTTFFGSTTTTNGRGTTTTTSG